MRDVGLRFATVGAGRMSTGHSAPHTLQTFPLKSLTKNFNFCERNNNVILRATFQCFNETLLFYLRDVGLRFATVGAGRMSTGHSAPHTLQTFPLKSLTKNFNFCERDIMKF